MLLTRRDCVRVNRPSTFEVLRCSRLIVFTGPNRCSVSLSVFRERPGTSAGVDNADMTIVFALVWVALWLKLEVPACRQKVKIKETSKLVRRQHIFEGASESP